MILTPEERRAALLLIGLVLLGEVASLWQDHRRTQPDRELSAWLTRIEAERRDSTSLLSDSAGAGRIEGNSDGRNREAHEPIRPARSQSAAKPERNEAPRPTTDVASRATASPERSAADTEAIEPASDIPPGLLESGRIRINEASASDLMELPGIGDSMAARILAERVRSGSFTGPEDLLRVRGIGPKTLARLRDRIDWSPPGAPQAQGRGP